MYVCVLSHSVMSNSLQPHGLQPARLLCPWNFPGNNTGVGCHCLLQGIFVTQGSNLCLLCLPHGRQILYHCTIWEVMYIYIYIYALSIYRERERERQRESIYLHMYIFKCNSYAYENTYKCIYIIHTLYITHTYKYIYLFQILSAIGYYKMLNIVSCAMQKILIAIYIYNMYAYIYSVCIYIYIYTYTHMHNVVP